MKFMNVFLIIENILRFFNRCFLFMSIFCLGKIIVKFCICMKVGLWVNGRDVFI